MTRRPRPLTHCRVPGHGTRCVVADEQDGRTFPRCTEERMAMDYETRADEDGTQEHGSVVFGRSNITVSLPAHAPGDSWFKFAKTAIAALQAAEFGEVSDGSA